MKYRSIEVDIRWGFMIVVLKLLSPDDVVMHSYNNEPYFAVYSSSKFSSLTDWARQ
jgi:hypothetical protein